MATHLVAVSKATVTSSRGVDLTQAEAIEALKAIKLAEDRFKEYVESECDHLKVTWS